MKKEKKKPVPEQRHQGAKAHQEEFVSIDKGRIVCAAGCSLVP
jgi:hypothetical protein